MINLSRLKQQRELLGCSPDAFAARVNLTPEQYAHIEANQRQPSVQEIELISNALGCTAAYLLNLTDAPDKQLTEADLSPDEKRFLEAIRDPHKRARLEMIRGLDSETKHIIEERARTSMIQRLLKPIRLMLIFPALLIPNTLTTVLTLIYGLVLSIACLILLFLLHLPALNFVLACIGLLILAGIIAVKAAQLTCELTVPVAVRRQKPKI